LTHPPARIVGLFLFGPHGRRLHDLIVEVAPTLGPRLGDLCHLTFVGHPRHGDASFRHFAKKKHRRSEARLVAEWRANVADHAGEQFTIAEEEADLAQRYHLAPASLPCLVLNTDPEAGAPIAVSIPDVAFATTTARRTLIAVIEKALGAEALGPLLTQHGALLVDVRRVLSTQAAQLQRTIDSIANGQGAVPERRRRARGAPKPGWIYLTDAAKKYGIPIKSLYRYKNELGKDTATRGIVCYDSESHEIQVEECSLKRVIDRHRSASVRPQ
jgi:hypothetical protein